MTEDELFRYMNHWEDEIEETEELEDCPDHLEHTAIMENEE